MATPTANTSKFGFEVKNLDAELRIAAFRGQEGMSQLFRFELDLVSEDPEIDFAKVVNQPAVITIEGQDETRYVHGIVQRFEQGDQGNRFTHYHVRLAPKMWWLGKRQDCRIFQDKNVQDIIDEVLKGAGLTQEDYRFSLDESYPNREYCVQYRETDLAFIERLMAEEGIFYYFEHNDQKHTLVIGDSSSSYGVIPGNETVPFVPATGAVSDEEHVTRFRYAEGVSSGEVVLRDFNFKKPGTNLEVTEDADQYSELSVYDYPGDYEEPDRGKTVKQIRMEELVAQRKRGSGATGCPRLIPGHKFTLDKHPRGSFNQGYLIITMVHEGLEPQALEEESGNAIASYNNTFKCIPIDVVYRPGRKALKPLVEGPQTAIVVGPNGEEIYTDEFGRIKVKFHWDRLGKGDENSSCWVRVSQAWAGAGWGTLLIPRIGHEVIVDFLEGDPDHPIVTGRVYHGTNRPPYKLPDEKTKSTLKSNSSKGGGGFNEIRLEDLKGSEEIYIHAQKDMNEDIGNNQTCGVGKDRTVTVQSDDSLTIGGGRTVNIAGKLDETIGKGETRTITNGSSVTITGNKTDTITGNVSESIVGNVTQTITGNWVQTVTGTVNITSLSPMTVTAPLGYQFVAPSSKEVKGLFDSTGGKSTEAFGFKFGVSGASIEMVGIAGAFKTVSAEHVGLKIDSAGMLIEKKPIELASKDASITKSELTLKNAVLHLFV